MTLVDRQGRVFGRWSVIDVVIGLVLLLLIPVLYGGYLLFRPAPATLVRIEPTQIAAQTDVDVTVTGTNLRPYMRVSFSHVQGGGFFFADATRARVPAERLAPGVYDVILYDHARELARLPRALEVVGAPSRGTQLDLIGSFTAITAEQADRLKAGAALPRLGTITRLGRRTPALTRTSVSASALVEVPSPNAFNVAAVVRADCTLTQRGGSATCSALDSPLMEDLVLRLVDSGGDLLFQIDQVVTTVASTPLTMRARLGGDRTAVERMRVGDRDLRRQNEFAAFGSIVAMEPARSASPAVAVGLAPQGPSTLPLVATDLAIRDVTLTVPAQRIGDAWYYAGHKLTIGGSIDFHGPDYQLRGTMLSVNTPAAARE